MLTYFLDKGQSCSNMHMISAPQWKSNSFSIRLNLISFYSTTIGKSRLCLFLCEMCSSVLGNFGAFPVSCFFFYTTVYTVPMCENTCLSPMGRSCVCYCELKRERDDTSHKHILYCTYCNVRSSGGTAMETNQHKYHFMSAGVFTCRFESVGKVQRDSSLSPESDPETTALSELPALSSPKCLNGTEFKSGETNKWDKCHLLENTCYCIFLVHFQAKSDFGFVIWKYLSDHSWLSTTKTR